MRAVIVTEPGGPDALEIRDLAVRQPGPGEARVRLRAAALNRLDLFVREGLPGVSYPRILGCEGAGVVEALGAETPGIALGDEVIVHPGSGCGRCRDCGTGRESFCPDYTMLGYQRDGTWAEAIVAPAACLLPRPEALSWEEAAAFPLVFVTAWHMIFERGRLRPGDAVLVMAAGSGVGQAAVQIARHAGARVVATAGSEAKRARALELGAQEAVDYTAEAWHERVLELTDGRGVDLVVDHTGRELFGAVQRCLARGGRHVLCGATTGPRVELDLRFVFARQQSIVGSYMGSRGELLEALELAEAGVLRPVIDRVFPLEEAAAAQQHMADRAQFGKIVLRIQEARPGPGARRPSPPRGGTDPGV